MGSLVKAALPAVAGLLIGGPLGGALGGELGLGAGVSSALGGALVGAGTAAATGQSPLTGALSGGLGGFGGMGGFSAAASSPGMAAISSAADPIEALNTAMTTTGASTASGAAEALGYSSPEAMLAAANPSWVGFGSSISSGIQQVPANLGLTNPTTGAAPGTVPALASKAATQAAGGLGTLGSVLNVGSGLYGLYNAYQMQQLAKQAITPNAMAPYQAQYAAQLAQLQANPSSITSMPDYQAGLDAVQRSMAAQGYQGSGNMAQALAQYGSSFYNQQVQQLEGLATAGANNTATGLSGLASGSQLASQSLASLGYGSRLLGW